MPVRLYMFMQTQATQSTISRHLLALPGTSVSAKQTSAIIMRRIAFANGVAIFFISKVRESSGGSSRSQTRSMTKDSWKCWQERDIIIIFSSMT